MVDRAWLSGLLRTPRADSTLLRASRELGDVDADSLTRDVVGISSRCVQPTEKMRESDRVRALRVDRTIPQAQLGKKPVARSNAGTLRVANME
jgi:hypothetical protein